MNEFQDKPKRAEAGVPAGDAQQEMKEEAPAWEMIEAGRYRPRRIRGSCRGRELG